MLLPRCCDMRPEHLAQRRLQQVRGRMQPGRLRDALGQAAAEARRRALARQRLVLGERRLEPRQVDRPAPAAAASSWVSSAGKP